MDHGSKNRLTLHDVDRFAGDTLFDKVARALCRAEVLPRKELYESWEVARRVHRLWRRRGKSADQRAAPAATAGAAPVRVVDLCCGHGLVGALLLVLEKSFARGLAVDIAPPPSQQTIWAALTTEFPRVALLEPKTARIEDVALAPSDVVVSAHGCGPLTDQVLAAAAAASAMVAVLPCCHVLPHRSEKADPLSGWLDGALAIDVGRAQRLQQAGYDVVTQAIDPAITPKNRLLIGLPPR